MSRENSQEFRMRKTQSDNNPTKDSAVLNGSDVSISTQSKEGRNAKALDYRNI